MPTPLPRDAHPSPGPHSVTKQARGGARICAPSAPCAKPDTVLAVLTHVDIAAHCPAASDLTPPGSLSVDGYRVLTARHRQDGETADDVAVRRHCEALQTELRTIRERLASLRRCGECDNGRAHLASPQGLRLRLSLIGLMIEHHLAMHGGSHMMPKALILAREIPDYAPSAATVVLVSYAYNLCPRWLLLGDGRAPESLALKR